MAITPVDIKSGLIKRDIDPTLAIEEVIVTALIYSGITGSVLVSYETPLPVVDPVNQELQQQILLELKKMNTYLSLLTDEQVNDYDTIKG